MYKEKIGACNFYLVNGRAGGVTPHKTNDGKAPGSKLGKKLFFNIIVQLHLF